MSSCLYGKGTDTLLCTQQQSFVDDRFPDIDPTGDGPK